MFNKRCGPFIKGLFKTKKGEKKKLVFNNLHELKATRRVHREKDQTLQCPQLQRNDPEAFSPESVLKQVVSRYLCCILILVISN